MEGSDRQRMRRRGGSKGRGGVELVGFEGFLRREGREGCGGQACEGCDVKWLLYELMELAFRFRFRVTMGAGFGRLVIEKVGNPHCLKHSHDSVGQDCARRSGLRSSWDGDAWDENVAYRFEWKD